MQDRFELIMEIFNKARPLSGEQRIAYLDQACPDAEIREEVESLLRNDIVSGIGGSGGGLLAGQTMAGIIRDGQDAIVAALAAQSGAPEEVLPAEIAGFTIIRLLGEGGMGRVYEAQQQMPGRRVALKVLKPGVASRALLRRFELETEVLGRLEHPGIARIYHAGMANMGHGPQPYFVMEFIDGQTLDKHLQQARPDLRRRLELLIEICQAVHHAHQRGIIHRDLKPSNILVDDKGQPRVVDFGVARIDDQEIKSPTIQTYSGQLLGTLKYMSPEQTLGDPGQVDVTSDIYALGVIAYEMLADRLPYGRSEQPDWDWVHAIREEEPVALGKLNRKYRGDIETIVGKSLAKERSQRYASAAELAADLSRYLKDEPIVARPPGTWYQISKFARRNKLLVQSAVLILLALVGGIVATTWQAVRATRAEKGLRETLAEVRARSAMLAYQRGAWETAISEYEGAIAAGHPDPIAMKLGRLRALSNSKFSDQVIKELDAMEKANPNAGHDAERLLLRGELTWGDPQSEDALRRALAKGLPPARAEYAMGMLAETAPEAAKHFRAALAADPYQYQASAALFVVLLCLGETDEAKEHLALLSKVCPDDPMVLVGKCLLFAFSDKGEDPFKYLSQVKGLDPEMRQQVEIAIELVHMTLESMAGRKPPPKPADVMMMLFKRGLAPGMPMAGAKPDQRNTLKPPRCLSLAFSRLPQLAIKNFASTDNKALTAELEQIEKQIPMQVVIFLRGGACWAAGERDKAIACFKKAAASPTLLDMRPSIYTAMMVCLLEDAVAKKAFTLPSGVQGASLWDDNSFQVRFTPELHDEMAKIGKGLLELGGPLADYSGAHVVNTMLLTDNVRVGRDLAVKWRQKMPENPEAWFMQIRAEWAMGDFSAALWLADEGSAEFPEDAALQQRFEEWKTKLLAFKRPATRPTEHVPIDDYLRRAGVAVPANK